jgi:transposase
VEIRKAQSLRFYGRPAPRGTAAALNVRRARARARARHPYKFDKNKAASIIAALTTGAFTEQVADCAGVDPRTVYRWLKKGKELSRLDRALTDDERAFADFYREAMKSNAQFEIHALASIARDSDWRAAAWRLERKFPQRWGNRKRVAIEGIDDDERLRKRIAESLAAGTTAKADPVRELYGIVPQDQGQDGADHPAPSERAPARRVSSDRASVKTGRVPTLRLKHGP